MTDVQLEHHEITRSGVRHPIRVIVHDLEVPMNVGSIFRIADALGVDRLYLTGSSATPPHSKIRKTSRATENAVDYEHRDDVLALVAELRAAGFIIVSLELTRDSIDIRAFDPPSPGRIALILGSENHGVSPALLDASDYTVHIPMAGQNSSLNVATACSIALYELLRGRLR
jgi:tRNA G18 (ribose-2'-O)-methylase SpoU